MKGALLDTAIQGERNEIHHAAAAGYSQTDDAHFPSAKSEATAVSGKAFPQQGTGLTERASQRRPESGAAFQPRITGANGDVGCAHPPTGEAAELLASGCNLDRKNPRAKEGITHRPPAQLAASILQKEQRIAEIMGNLQKLLAKQSR